ncbi:MAG: two-component system OmpR family sensor kinase [Alphaproteobacteria bacterium]|jgi:two-component system OmpR family sensor kinase
MAIVATFGVGWLVDVAYDQYKAEQQTKDVDKLKLMEQLGTGLAHTLDQMINKEDFVNHWQESENEYQIDLVGMAELPLPMTLLNQIKNGEVLLLESAKHLTFHYYLATTNEIFTLKTPIGDIAPTENTINYLFTLVFYAVLSILLLLWVYPLIMQLIKLRKAAKSFGEGDLSQRINISPLSYIGEIEYEFNQMAQRIEDLVTDVKLLGSAVSHDLRTPLARIQFGIDTLQEEENPETRRKYEQKISDNVVEMTSLVETLLRYARLDQNMLEMKKERVELVSLIDKCTNNVKRIGLDICLHMPKEALFINGDATYITMLINNLLHNAVTYGDSIVKIELEEQGTNAVMTISDNGSGIDEHQQLDMLKPFVRGNNNGIKGHGFGLAIVKRILDWHKGSIHISNSSTLLGAQIVVTLPILPNERYKTLS